MTLSPPQKDSKLGKGYSYGIAIALTVFITMQSLNFQFKNNKAGDFEVEFGFREVPLKVFAPCVFLIASALGFSTDGVAIAFGHFLELGRKDKD